MDIDKRTLDALGYMGLVEDARQSFYRMWRAGRVAVCARPNPKRPWMVSVPDGSGNRASAHATDAEMIAYLEGYFGG